jgi:hypothetical protein
MNITIKKASLRGSLFLSYDFEQQDADVKNLIKTSSDAPIHDDLRNAYRRLIPHFAFICEEVKDEELVRKAIENPDSYLYDRELAPDDTFFKFRVTEFAIEEKKGFEYVSLHGCKSLATFQEVCWPTPKIDLDDSSYPFRSELTENIEDLKAEVLAYMQGKQAPKTQLEMFNEEEEEEETPAPKKKRSKKAESAFVDAE